MLGHCFYRELNFFLLRKFAFWAKRHQLGSCALSANDVPYFTLSIERNNRIDNIVGYSLGEWYTCDRLLLFVHPLKYWRKRWCISKTVFLYGIHRQHSTATCLFWLFVLWIYIEIWEGESTQRKDLKKSYLFILCMQRISNRRKSRWAS